MTTSLAAAVRSYLRARDEFDNAEEGPGDMEDARDRLLHRLQVRRRDLENFLKVAPTLPATPDSVFTPQWPPGLRQADINERPPRAYCDDKYPHEANAWLTVLIGPDGDIYPMMAEQDVEASDHPPLFGFHPTPGIRVRTHAGGGRNARTHQALLWLALAIQLDVADHPPPPPTLKPLQRVDTDQGGTDAT